MQTKPKRNYFWIEYAILSMGRDHSLIPSSLIIFSSICLLFITILQAELRNMFLVCSYLWAKCNLSQEFSHGLHLCGKWILPSRAVAPPNDPQSPVALALPACDTLVRVVTAGTGWPSSLLCAFPGALMMWSIVRNKGPLHLDMDKRSELLKSLKELSFTQ